MQTYFFNVAGKRKAPKPPPPMPPMPPKPLPIGESNYERLGKVAKVNKVQKIDKIDESESQMSPRLWFRKSKKSDQNSTLPNGNGLQKSKSQSSRPISLLASISDFDREAAKIVEQRQKDEQKRRYINDASFYVQADKNEHPQEAIDEIMANVEQKMECLDAIGKHNNRWEEKLEGQRESFDMNGLVSDLNQFLNTTRREMMTPKTARKLGQAEGQSNVTNDVTETAVKAENESDHEVVKTKKNVKSFHTETIRIEDKNAMQNSLKAEDIVQKAEEYVAQHTNPRRNKKALKNSAEFSAKNGATNLSESSAQNSPHTEIHKAAQSTKNVARKIAQNDAIDGPRNSEQKVALNDSQLDPQVMAQNLAQAEIRKAELNATTLRTRKLKQNEAQNVGKNFEQKVAPTVQNEAMSLNLVTDRSKGAISKVKNEQRRPKTKKTNEYEETWSCAKCTLINSVTNKVCILCGATSGPPLEPSPFLEKSESSASIFDARDENDEEMPKRGNVLDRVVQFTAIQMMADERPTSAMTSRTETPRNSQDFDRPMSAMNANELIFTPTPIVHRVQNGQNKPYNDSNRKSVLEKEDTADILAKWKAEHEEREKLRKEFFANFAPAPAGVTPVTPKDSVLEQQKALLEQASKNLDKKTKEIEQKVETKIAVKNSGGENVTKLKLPLGLEQQGKVDKENKVANKTRKPENSTKSHESLSNTNSEFQSPKGNKDEISKIEPQRVQNRTNPEAKADQNIETKSRMDQNRVKTEARIDHVAKIDPKINQSVKIEAKLAKSEEHQKAKNMHKNPQNLKNSTFDPSKTPSSFIHKPMQSESSDTFDTATDTSDTVDAVSPDDITKEALRQKRLEYFVKVQSPPNTMAKKSTFERQSEVKKAIEMDENMDFYDVPITPPRKVPDSFFRERNLPHPFKKPKNTQAAPKKSEKRISTTSSEYEPILIDSTLESSKAAKVVKVENPMTPTATAAQVSDEKNQVKRLEIKALKLSGDIPQPQRPQRRNKFGKTPQNPRKTLSKMEQKAAQNITKKDMQNSLQNNQFLEQKVPQHSSQNVTHNQKAADNLPRNTSQKVIQNKAPTPVQNARKPISRKVDEIDDLVAKKVENNEPMKNVDRSISIPNEPKKHPKKSRNKRFSREVKSVPKVPEQTVESEWQKEVQKQRNEVEKLQREIQMLQKEVLTPAREIPKPEPKPTQNHGARPKNYPKKKPKVAKSRGSRYEKVMSAEIVDDVLYIPGPIKKDFKQKFNENNQQEPLAFALIPSDKFDPNNTLTKKKNAKNNPAASLQMDEIHVEATLPSPSRRE